MNLEILILILILIFDQIVLTLLLLCTNSWILEEHVVNDGVLVWADVVGCLTSLSLVTIGRS